MLKTTITYKLQVPIEVNNAKVEQLTMKAPTSEFRALSNRLKQTVMNAIMKVAKQDQGEEKKGNKKQDNEGITSEAITTMLFASDANIEDCFNAFESLMISKDMCKLDNQAQMSRLIFQDLYQQDVENMLGEYISNFLLPSQMK